MIQSTLVITMRQETKAKISASMQSFRLPRYQEIPNVGLYLEQTSKYISEYIAPLGECALTSSMISNYVKKGLISSPVKKQYSRDQLVYLMFIALAKSVLSLDALADFFQLQQRTYPLEIAYDYFCQEFESLLFFSFEMKDSIESSYDTTSDEKRLLYTCIVAITQKVYLEKCLRAIALEEQDDNL